MIDEIPNGAWALEDERLALLSRLSKTAQRKLRRPQGLESRFIRLVFTPMPADPSAAEIDQRRAANDWLQSRVVEYEAKLEALRQERVAQVQRVSSDRHAPSKHRKALNQRRRRR